MILKDINNAMVEIAEIFLTQKHMTGYKYNSQEKYLRRFVEYYNREGYTGIRITKPMVENFIYDSNERPYTHYTKETILRDFAKFLINQGFNEVYVPSVRTAIPRCKHIPYIFTDNEIKRIFSVIDTWEGSFFTNCSQVDPVLFRILYATGMRLSEALNLTVADFHSIDGTLTVYHAKNNKDRIIPLASSLVQKLSDYISIVHRFSENSTYLFNVGTGERMDNSTAYRRFRQYILKAGIPHTKAGPRIHDLRHNFAIKCLKKRILAGEELTNILPYLAAYMGHSDFRGTQYYDS